MSDPHRAPDGPPGGRFGDDDLGRLLGEGLRRSADGPVDGRSLVSGAQRGAVRIRQRRRAVTTVAALVVLVPAGLAGVLRTVGSDASGGASTTAADRPAAADAQEDTAGRSAGDGASPLAGPGYGEASKAAVGAGALASSAAGAGSAPATGPPRPATAPTRLTAVTTAAPTLATPAGGTASSPAPQVPGSALLTAADLVPVTGSGVVLVTQVAPAPALVAPEVCGGGPGAVPAATSSRVATFRRGDGATAWAAASAVRVLPGTGAKDYLAVLDARPCLAAVVAGGADAALVGRATDSAGTTRWLAVARVGGAVAEVRVAAPQGATVGEVAVTRLLTTAVTRLTASGAPTG